MCCKQENREEDVPRQPVVLPHRLGLHSTTPGCAAKPHSRAPDQGLDDDPRDGDKSKRTVPSRKMRRIVAIFLQDDGEPSREDERDTDTNHGDLVPLETCSLCVGL